MQCTILVWLSLLSNNLKRIAIKNQHTYNALLSLRSIYEKLIHRNYWTDAIYFCYHFEYFKMHRLRL